MQSLHRHFQFHSLDELLQIGLDQAQRLLPLYAEWPESQSEDFEALNDVFVSTASILEGEAEVLIESEECEAAYLASSRAAAGFRKSKAEEAQLAVYAGKAISSMADAIADRQRDPQAARISVILAISVSMRADETLSQMQ